MNKMVLTVTINPLLERRYSYSNLDFNSVNRDGRLILKAGGKGINVSRQLNKLDIVNLALLFSGGTNGKLLRESLKHEGINFSDVNIRSDSRDASIIIDQSKEKIYSFFGENPLLSSNEVNNFIIKLEKAVATCEIVIFSGSSPCKEADKIFPIGISIANRLDKISICDTYGNHLEDCLNASPTVVHNNTDEIKSSLRLTLENESDQLKFLEMLYKKGIKQAYITNAAGSFYASNFDFHYKVNIPEISTIDSTGSGDAFVAGIAFGWHNKFTFEQQVRFAAALGVLNAESLEVCDVELESADAITSRISIEPVGKKLKKINDKPD